MELNQIHYALKLAKYLHFSKAANSLSITQPTLSQQINKLETELGVKLFERRTRSVRLTLAGEEFIAHANRVINELKLLQDTIQKYSTKANENIYIGGCVPHIGGMKLGEILRQFQNNHGDITTKLIEKPGSYDLVKLLTANQIDGAFLVLSNALFADPAFTSHVLIPGQVHVIMRNDHVLATKDVVSLQDLSQESCIAFSSTFSIFGAVDSVCKNNGYHLRIVSTCNSIETMIDLVACGFGIAFLSSQFATAISHPLVTSRLISPFIDRNLSFVHLADKPQSQALGVFSQFICNQFGFTSTSIIG